MVFSSLQLRLFLLYLSLFFIIFFKNKFWTLKNINKVKKDMNIKFWYIKKENFGQGQGGQVPPLDPPWLRPWLYPLVALISKFKHQGSCCCCMAQRDWDHKLQGNLREILFLSMLVSLSLSLSLSRENSIILWSTFLSCKYVS